ncbi:peptidase S58 DmpA [Neokomagataea thailandica NBRC 106555]|uniref:Peptidase S58 family protein n=2 Tax=Neokomagataea TaxID=1223423 RepID=A0A4Y6V6I8_9PROT|nr:MULTISPECIES: P1 family peptidase [Neokomagataea]QDH24250.1 peptidase S58 family protein [Neokomagataea tanensis]GBR52946.1 peptidase S58 DmpA [Neokomagataea thailandica NBRC 106555]
MRSAKTLSPHALKTTRRGLIAGGAAFLFNPPHLLSAPPRVHGKVGPRNLITDVPGIKVGYADAPSNCTGVTVILPDTHAIAAVDIRGGGPATRETDTLTLGNLVHTVDAIVLSGGSVYGLAAGDGAAAWLGAHGRGFSFHPSASVPSAPIVPTAALYDLATGGDKNWGEDPPYHALGLAAVSRASETFPLGTHGAGFGATAGALKGGLGSASYITHEGITVGAIVACNSFGSVVAPGGKQFWAGTYEVGREFGGLGAPKYDVDSEDWGLAKLNPAPRANTTLACIATDIALSNDELKRVAMMAQNGMGRAIRPVHSPFDGDIIFALSTSRQANPHPATSLERDILVTRIGSIASDVLARAIARGVYLATCPPGMTAQQWSSL